MADYKDAFHSMAADMSAILAALGFHQGMPKLGIIIERIESMKQDHFRDATKMIVDQVIAKTNGRRHSDWPAMVEDIINTADQIRSATKDN